MYCTWPFHTTHHCNNQTHSQKLTEFKQVIFWKQEWNTFGDTSCTLNTLQKESTVSSVVLCCFVPAAIPQPLEIRLFLFVITFFPVAGHKSWHCLQIATARLNMAHLGEVSRCECSQIWEKCRSGRYFCSWSYLLHVWNYSDTFENVKSNQHVVYSLDYRHMLVFQVPVSVRDLSLASLIFPFAQITQTDVLVW